MKGHSLDKSVPSSYRPISNLNFISKVLERLFLARFQAHILASLNFDKYRTGCSAETVLQLLDHTTDFFYSDEGKLTLLVSLDLSAAFDMIDRAVLLKRLTCSFGVTGTVHSWTQFYLCGRTRWWTLISCNLMLCGCASGLCPWATMYPAPGRGTGYCFRAISFFLSVSLSATLRENGWTDLHEIFREGVE